MTDYFGAKRRFSDRQLECRVAAVRDAVQRVAFDHSYRRPILDTFVEVYREMEGDERLDGGCHLLAAHAHVVLREHGVANELHVGEILFDGGGGTHSWVEVGDVRFDVAMARPGVENRVREQAAILCTTEIPSGHSATVRYDVRGMLDDDGQIVAGGTIGTFAAGLRELGFDFWFWVERTCRRMALRNVRATKLSAKYGSERWNYRDPRGGMRM